MCGIVGVVSAAGVRSQELTAMSAAVEHRGPDGRGWMLYSPSQGVRVGVNKDIPGEECGDAQVGFGHRRLAIIDLSAANSQPMLNEDGSLCIAYNGEVYNYRELRTELQGLGFSFRTNGDTEVLLHAYEAWGAAFASRLNGMWALAILDVRNQRVFLSRDRTGIKPLYYAVSEGALYFASEIKALLAVPGLDRGPNERSVARFLTTGAADDSEETFFEGIRAFPPAHSAMIHLGGPVDSVEAERYWTLPPVSFAEPPAAAVAEFRRLFLDALTVHAHSDVRVGTCLSGGLDSSSIVGGSESLRSQGLIPSYAHSAIGYRASDSAYREERYMDLVAKATGVRMHYVDISQERFDESVESIIRTQDEPFGSASIVAQWFVFEKAAEQGLKVMLDGQGADETLAGYHHYFATMALGLLSEGRVASYLALRTRYEREIGPFPLAGGLLAAAARRMFASWRPTALALAGARRLVGHLKRDPEPTRAASSPFTPTIHDAAVSATPPAKSIYSLDHELRTQTTSASLPALLRYEDRNSMAHSIEARVPFLDARLVDFAFTLPEKLKIRGVTTKYVLREAMRGLIPEEIRTRKDKIGFRASPEHTNLFVRKNYGALCANGGAWEEKWFRTEGVKRMFDEAFGTAGGDFPVWRVINVKLWARQHWS
jgi:asparagine synthase (glutamine-hydrolysing)